jgi:hypothetical protein
MSLRPKRPPDDEKRRPGRGGVRSRKSVNEDGSKRSSQREQYNKRTAVSNRLVIIGPDDLVLAVVDDLATARHLLRGRWA